MRPLGPHLVCILVLLTVASPVAGSGIITASPNPVPAGRDAGRTTVTWRTDDGRPARVMLSVSGAPEVLFADAPHGAKEAPWIAETNEYEFRLYDSASKAALGSVKVTRLSGREAGAPSVPMILAVAVLGLAVAAAIFGTIARRARHRTAG